MSSLRSRALSGVLWMVVQTWLVRITTVGSFIILSRHLSPAEFGLVSLAMAVIAVLTMLSDSGMATFLVRRSDVSPTVLSTAFWTSMALATALAGLLALLAGPASALFGEPHLAPVLRWLSIGVLLTGLSSVPSALLKRDMRFKELAVRGVVATTSGSVVAIALALAGAGVWALVAQSLVRGAVAVVIIWSASGWRPSWSWDRQQAGEMLRFGGNLLSIDLLMQARDRGEEFTLAAVSGATTLGYWSVASRLVKILQEVSSSVISSVATPAFAKLQHEPERLYRAYATSMASAGLVLFPLMLFLSVTSPDLVPLLLGEQWATTAAVAQVTALTAVVGVFSYFDRTVFVAFGRLRPEVLLVAGIVALHTAIVVTVAHYGLLVLAIALAVRALVTFPVRQFVLHRYAGVPYRALLPACRVLVAALLMAVAVLGTSTALQDDGPWLRLVLCAGVAALTYPPLLLLLARPVVLPLLRDVVAARRRAKPRQAIVAPAVVELGVPRQAAPRTPEEVRR